MSSLVQRSHGSRTWSILAILVVALGAGGCAPPNYADYGTFLRRPRAIVGSKPYVIEPPDQIRVIAPEAEELNNVTVSLRPDGYITLWLLGDMFAAGKTPTQLAAEIEEEVLRYYEDVTVQVEVTGFNSKFYYMAGEFGAGLRAYNGRDTIFRLA